VERRGRATRSSGSRSSGRWRELATRAGGAHQRRGSRTSGAVEGTKARREARAQQRHQGTAAGITAQWRASRRSGGHHVAAADTAAAAPGRGGVHQRRDPWPVEGTSSAAAEPWARWITRSDTRARQPKLGRGGECPSTAAATARTSGAVGVEGHQGSSRNSGAVEPGRAPRAGGAHQRRRSRQLATRRC
jgi:hypothetical protein